MTKNTTCANSVTTPRSVGQLSKKQINAVWYSILKCIELSVIPEDEFEMMTETAAQFANAYDKFDELGGVIDMEQTRLKNAYHAVSFILSNKQFEVGKQVQHAKKAKAVLYVLIEKDGLSRMKSWWNKLITVKQKANGGATKLMHEYGTETIVGLVVIGIAWTLGYMGVFDAALN